MTKRGNGKMKKWKAVSAVFVSAVMMILGVSAVWAQEVHFTGEKCPMIIYDTMAENVEENADEQTGAEGAIAEGADVKSEAGTTYMLDQIDILGVIDENWVAVAYMKENEAPLPQTEQNVEEQAPVVAKTYGYVKLDDLEKTIPLLDPASLEQVNGWQDLVRGSTGEYVARMQEALISLGFQEGAADGSYGPGTLASVKAYLTSKGYPENDVLNLFQYLELRNALNPSGPVEYAYPPVLTIENKYAEIYESAQHPEWLEQLLDVSWKLQYDALDGTGCIYKKPSLVQYEELGRSIDQIKIELYPVILLERTEEGIQMTPVLRYVSKGSYRPYIQSGALQSGNVISDLMAIPGSSWIEGIQISEEGYLELNDAAINSLIGYSGGNALLRLKGATKDHDIDLGETVMETLRQFAGIVNPA